MPRRKKKLIKCKNCGYEWLPNEVEPEKTWNLVSPMPDKKGNITVTVMAVWICPNCGSKVKGVYSKIKVGEEIKGIDRRKILIETLNSVDKITIKEAAEKIRVSEETARKAIEYLIKKGEVVGEIEGDTFIRRS